MISLVKPDWMPQAFFNAVQRDKKERLPGVDYTVTELLAPARERELLRRHDVEISGGERIWALIGKGLHGVLDHGTAEHEVTMVAELDGVRISGTADMIAEGVIHDWKLCSVYAWIFGLKEEWEHQLNCYAWLMRRPQPGLGSYGYKGAEASDLQVHMIFRDWHRSKANGIDYPATEMHSISVVKWSDEKATEFLRSRIKAHQAAKDALPECTDAERWHKPGMVAVMKRGRKSALRLLKNVEEATAWAEKEGVGGLYLEHRPGKDVRCLDWCQARSVCEHALKLRQETTDEASA